MKFVLVETMKFRIQKRSFGIQFEIFGVGTTEAQEFKIQQQHKHHAQGQFKPAHSGWVGITTYVDTHGNLRVKSETLVAGGGLELLTLMSIDDTIT